MTCLNPNTKERAKSVFIQVFLSAPAPAPSPDPAPAPAPAPRYLKRFMTQQKLRKNLKP